MKKFKNKVMLCNFNRWFKKHLYDLSVELIRIVIFPILRTRSYKEKIWTFVCFVSLCFFYGGLHPAVIRGYTQGYLF